MRFTLTKKNTVIWAALSRFDHSHMIFGLNPGSASGRLGGAERRMWLVRVGRPDALRSRGAVDIRKRTARKVSVVEQWIVWSKRA